MIAIEASERRLRASDEGVGMQMHELVRELYPICRSITGEGVRETLRRIRSIVPLTINEVPSGTRVFDWTVPREWNIRDAYIKDSAGRKIVDFAKSSLHVLSYSTPVHAVLGLDELADHLFTSPEHPEWIPYRTSYYRENWGFCISRNQKAALRDDRYEVVIDSTLADGHLSYGEYHLPGEIDDEVLLSCHVCHPALCNDNLSGIALCAFLARFLLERPRRYSYRFLFVPGTIGAITWLAQNQHSAARIRHGLVVACVGDSGGMTYKTSRRGDAEIDQAVMHVLKHSGKPHEIVDFSPYGYDERQYCSPGFDLAVGSLTRTPHGRFPQYHTSADDLEFVKPECLADSLETYKDVVSLLEHNRRYVNLNPNCEPQLGRRGLYRQLGGVQSEAAELAVLWVLNQSDGGQSLLDIARRAGLPFDLIRKAADALLACDLLEERR